MPLKRNLKKEQKSNDQSNSTAFSESRWSVMNYLQSLDMFGQPIPAFNIKGKDQVQTVVGGFLSAVVMTLTLGFAIIGMHDLISKSDPTINSNIVHSYYGTEEDGLNFSKANQRLAISVLGWDQQTKYDPKHVRLVATYETRESDGTLNR